MKILTTVLCLIISLNISAKDVPMKEGYRQLRLTTFPKVRSGIMAFVYSEASSANDSYLKGLNRTQELMMETIVNSLKTGRVPMANSIWKKFVKSLKTGVQTYNINNIIFNIIERAYLEKKYTLSYRAKLYKVLNDKVNILEIEKDEFKEIYKTCKENSECSYDTKDEIDRTNKLWKKRTSIFNKEMKRSKKRLEELYDEEDGFSRLTLQVSKRFFESAEDIVSSR